MRNPEIYSAEYLKLYENQTEITVYEDRNDDRKIPVSCKWVAARPLGRSGPFWHRFKLAWLVFTGKCDVLKWYKQ
jgi:hypothetical protein